jgi:hypothetical protein
MKSDKAGRKALIAELGFSLMVERLRPQETPTDPAKINEIAWNETRRRLKPFLGQGVDLDAPLQQSENIEVAAIEKRLMGFFNGNNFPIVARPLFKGCGFVDASEGDILTKSTLFEVKTVDRSFRSADLRQLLTYSALNSASREADISAVGLVNPRRGVSCEMQVGELCLDISGRSAENLFAMIVQVFSSGEISR